MASSISDILSAIQSGVIALNNMAVQIRGSFNNILSRFVTDEANIATNTAAIAVLATPACFSVHKNGTDQVGVADSTFTAITFGTEVYDIGSHFAANTWTPPSGKIHLDAATLVSGTIAVGAQIAIAIYKNGADFKQNNDWAGAANIGAVSISFDDIANGTDAYTVQVFIDVTAGTATISGATTATYFTGHWFSA